MGGRHLHHLWLQHNAIGYSLYLLRKGGTEQQGLARCRSLVDDSVQCILKPHIQHAIRFIQNQNIHIFQLESTPAQVIFYTPWRTHNDMGPMFQRSCLGAEWCTTTQGQHLDVVDGPAQPPDLLGYLISKFPGGTEDQSLYTKTFYLQFLQQS